MQLAPHRLSVQWDTSVLQLGRLIPDAIERRTAEAPHWQQANSFLHRSLPLSCVLALEFFSGLAQAKPGQKRPYRKTNRLQFTVCLQIIQAS
jgi:hypothetical protein